MFSTKPLLLLLMALHLATPIHFPALQTNYPAFDASSRSNKFDSVSTFSWNHTTTGTDRILLISVTNNSSGNNPVLSVTYAGVSATLAVVNSVGGANDTEVWYVVAPATGTNSIIVTFTTGVLNAFGQALSLTQVNQTQPIDATATNSAFSGSPISTSIATATKRTYVFDTIHTFGLSNVTPATAQTLLQSYNVNSDTVAQSSQLSPVAQTLADSWTFNASGIASLTVVSIKGTTKVRGAPPIHF